jgi:hypothetical protein
MRAAAKVNACHFDGRERHDVRRVTRHDSLEAIADADHLYALENGADGGRCDDTVDSRGGAAPDEDGELALAHGT